MPEYTIDQLQHPLLEPYREIRSRNWTEQSGIFIAEGPLLVEQLLLSPYGTKSVLLDRKYFSHYRDMLPEDVDVLLVEHDFVESIVGFDFHRGVIGCGYRLPIRSVRDSFLAPPEDQETIAAVIGVQDPENLGGILRCCAGLGIQRVLIGPGTADPLARRVLRVSMGTVLHLDVIRSTDFVADIQWLKQQRGIETLATSLQAPSEPLETASRSGPVMIVFGNERFGIPQDVQQVADRRIRINMELATDSLNVCVSAGIVLHYFCRLAPVLQPPIAQEE
ncbi:TrmH family RNA methyltransferase [Aureliella helgolandensis]|uniref:TrmH family tRNA/rRNA methyltransferase n=1 Tax=Aureliella helgolandensis TaxID=2527968 RepID=A0A518G8Y0_9BACT|nr:RNA methyltransferase [Aureliella helgolandensis]QDV25032.1 Putative TrmH family tRNA/rRNA methyltransferase [Aureliella helgolandensis]